VYLFTVVAKNEEGEVITESTAVYKKPGSAGGMVNPYKDGQHLAEFAATTFRKAGIRDSFGYEVANSKVMDFTTYATQISEVQQRVATTESFLGVKSEAFAHLKVAAQDGAKTNISPPGYDATIDRCLFYRNKANAGKLKVSGFDYRTTAYVINAFCACLTVTGPKAKKVRRYLQYDVDKGNDNGQTVFDTEDIYVSHVKAYEYAQCKCGPAAYWAWLGVTNIPLKLPDFWNTIEDKSKPLAERTAAAKRQCALVGLSINVMGSCHGCYIGYCPTTDHAVQAHLHALHAVLDIGPMSVLAFLCPFRSCTAAPALRETYVHAEPHNHLHTNLDRSIH